MSGSPRWGKFFVFNGFVLYCRLVSSIPAVYYILVPVLCFGVRVGASSVFLFCFIRMKHVKPRTVTDRVAVFHLHLVYFLFIWQISHAAIEEVI